MSFNGLLNKSGTIYTTSYTTNAIGERVTSKTELATISCRLDRLSGKNAIYLDNLSTYVNVRIFAEYRSDFTEWDYIEVDNTEYTIYSKNDLQNYSTNHHIELDCYVNKQK